ncbi:MAG: cysteine--tRNA ligase [Gammaproteobacteria bacterium]|nr:cysteine--tRNA ligase [Gammaproteobacteria bacterium]
MLHLYNSLTRKKEPFHPLRAQQVKLYVCGMTVYDFCHLGHARVLVIFDVLTRYLRSAGLEVTYVRNITDLDDKIIQRAKDNSESVKTLTDRFIAALREDEKALYVLPPTRCPRATEYIQEMLTLIQTLVEKKYAYVVDNGDVYFDVHRFTPYGKLSKKTVSELMAGARVEIDLHKHSPVDFALWKAAKPDEPSWKSPWGYGRPGWHIECSAMAMACLGNTFDLHGGGIDLQFPHHENEIAQSEAATGEPFVKRWMHVGFVEVNQEKMSKSLGNFFTVRELLAKFPAEAIRYLILSSHYRSPLNYSEDQLHTAGQNVEKFYLALRDLPSLTGKVPTFLNSSYESAFHQAMEDDLNTPEALSVLHALVHEINKHKGEEKAVPLALLLKSLANVLGLLQQEPNEFLRAHHAHETLKDSEIEKLIQERNEARHKKDWRKADSIRTHLEAQGIILEDGSAHTLWRRR